MARWRLPILNAFMSSVPPLMVMVLVVVPLPPPSSRSQFAVKVPPVRLSVPVPVPEPELLPSVAAPPAPMVNAPPPRLMTPAAVPPPVLLLAPMVTEVAVNVPASMAMCRWRRRCWCRWPGRASRCRR